MRSPEHRYPYAQKNGHYNNNEEHKARYNTNNPGAFTILPPDEELPPDPPHAPQPYRLTPSSRRHRNLAFSILPDANLESRPGSRSPSPTSGRVSPFKGRGFNPAGSRHASPAPTPPLSFASPNHSRPPPHSSKIPKLTRRGSATLFGEKITDYHQTTPTKRKPINRRLSQSMTNLNPGQTINKNVLPNRPPVAPNRRPGLNRQLSPIVGSSPEPSQSQSSPRYAPKTRSQPASPMRSNSFVHNNKTVTKRPPIRAQSRHVSREASPSATPTSPTRIPIKKYNSVQAKVNSYHKPKPKNSDATTNVDKINAAPEKNSAPENVKGKIAEKPKPLSRIASTKNLTKSEVKIKSEPKADPAPKSEPAAKPETPVKLSDLLQPSATTMVSSTTSTVTQPLKIDAKIEAPSDTISPMVDGRVLSATSVSNAMNKMNDSVLNSQTLIKDHGLTKLSPAASAIIQMSNSLDKTPNSSTNHQALDTKNATNALPSVEVVPNSKAMTDRHEAMTNHVGEAMERIGEVKGGLPSVRVLEKHVQNNMANLVAPGEQIMGSKSVNERIREARTVVAHNVKPIRILVKEKPMDAEVQSGNIRFDTTNGLGERPGLPPPNQASNEPAASNDAPAPTPTNCCTRFFSTCKKKVTCKNCKKQTTEQTHKKMENESQTDENETKTGCFNCRSKKSDVRINIEESQDDKAPKKCWDMLKCCGRNRVDTSCFSGSKRKGSWKERRDSILSDLPPRGKCSSFFRKLFCLDCCSKKVKRIELEEPSRRASMISKKKSLTPSVPHEETKPKIDMSLVEHTSQMKGAIPILPVCLAWFCLVMNCIAPGTGTVFSGMFCLCIGKPRFSQNDGPRPRIGSFIINLFIGFGQFFTVLFCLVGWGWSIWWGLIMIKIAKKHKKIQAIEAANLEAEAAAKPPAKKNGARNSQERKT